MTTTEEYLKSVMNGRANRLDSVSNYVNRIFYATRFLGVHPFQSDARKGRLEVIYSVVLTLTAVTLTGYGLTLTEVVISPFIREGSSVFLRICMERFLACIITFSAVYAILEVLVSKNRLEKIVKSLNSVDKFMLQIALSAPRPFVKDLSTLTLRILLVLTSGLLFVNARGGRDARFIAVYTTAYVLPLLVVTAVEFKHNALLHLIERRFDALRIRVDDMNRMNSTVSMSLKCELEMMVKVYTILVEISNRINDIYGRQILIIIGTIFITVTTSANFIIEDFIDLITQKKVNSFPEMCMNSYIAVGGLSELWLIISACDGVVEKAKEFTASLYELMIQDGSLVISKNKKLFLHISSHKEPVFTAYGFFNLDYSLFHSVIAAATTYLVILIQFSQKS